MPPAAALLPRFALVAFVLAVVISLLPIVTKYREISFDHWGGVGGAVLRHAGWIALFILSSIHLTNMRITPLIYFRF
jgi:hypothetical protein